MEFSIEIDFDEIDEVASVGDMDEVFRSYDIMDARREVINRERLPKWLFVDPNGFVSLTREFDDHVVTKETILRSPVLTDYEDAMDALDGVMHESASGMIFGMQMVETTDLSREAYVMPDDDGVPDTSCAVYVDY